MQLIERKSLRERVISMLREAIINGELKPGQPLASTELSTQLGVSQATLRDAIHALSGEGLVEIIAYHVPTVKKFTKQDIEDLFKVRLMIEVFSIREIISSNNLSKAVEELYVICDEMKMAADEDSLADVNWSDRTFHDTIIQLSGNVLLAEIWNTVSLRVQQVMVLRNQKKGDLHQIAKNHLEITQVIENKDVEKAIQLLNAHVVFVADVIADAWVDEYID